MSDSKEPMETTPESQPRVKLNKTGEEASGGDPRPDEATTVADEKEPFGDERTREEDAPTGGPSRVSAKDAEIARGSASRWNLAFDGLAKAGPIFPLLVLCAMVIPNYFSAVLFCPAEVKNVTAFLQCLTDQSWFTPIGWNPPGMEIPSFIAAQGLWGPSVAQWPAFYWLAGLLAFIPGLVASGLLLPVASSVSAGFALLAVWYLCIAAKFGYRAAFAASAIFLCAPVLAPLPHFVGDAALAVGFVLFAVAFFSRGLLAGRAYVSLPLAFICATFAGFSGGPLLFLLPLAVAVCFLIWKGDFKRAQRMDALSGFVCMLILVGLWLGELQFADNGNAYLRELFSQAWSLRFPLPPYWFLPLVIAVFGAMPWILTIFGVSWVRVLKTSPQTIGDSRRINGSALVWISLVLAACLPFFTGRFHLVATLIICIETALLGKAFVILPPAGNRLFFFLAPLFLVAVGVLILLVSFGATQAPLLGLLPFKPTPVITDALLNLDFLPIIGGVVLLGGILGFTFSRWYKKNGGLVYALLFVIVLTQPFLLGLSPEIGALTNSPLMTLKQVEEKYAARQIAAPVAPEQKAPAVIPPETPETVAPAPAEVVSPARPVAPAVEPAPPAAEPVIPDVSGALAPKSSTPEQNSAEPNAAPAIPESAPALPEGAPADVVAPRLDATNLPAIPETKPAIPQAPETNAVPKKEIIEEIIIVEPDGKEAEELAKDLAKEIEKEAAPAPEAPAQTPEAPAQ